MPDRPGPGFEEVIISSVRMTENIVTSYWRRFYAGAACTLCGNSGVIDSRGRAMTAVGVAVGRLNYCICPNGMVLRRNRANPEDHLDERRRR